VFNSLHKIDTGGYKRMASMWNVLFCLVPDQLVFVNREGRGKEGYGAVEVFP